MASRRHADRRLDGDRAAARRRRARSTAPWSRSPTSARARRPSARCARARTALKLAMEAAQMGLWYWDATTDDFTYSDGLNPLFGRPSTRRTSTTACCRSRCTPTTAGCCRRRMRHAVKARPGFPDRLPRGVARRLGALDRQPRPGASQRRRPGAAAIVGVAMDITERKHRRAAHRAHGAPRRAHGAAEPRAAARPHPPGDRAGAPRRQRRSRCSSSTSTASRRSTTRSATRSATGCCSRWRAGILVCLREGDTVSRLGGDEFVIVIPGDRRRAGRLAPSPPRSSRCSRTPFHLQGNDLHVSASVGISLYPADGADAETLMRNADTAMYHAKDAGRVQLPVLHAAHERRGAAAAHARERAAPGARQQRVRAALPAALRPARPLDHRARGAAALASARAASRCRPRSSSPRPRSRA